MQQRAPQHVVIVIDTSAAMRQPAFPRSRQKGFSCLDGARMGAEQFLRAATQVCVAQTMGMRSFC